jgi:hypothetical protein
MTSESTVDGFVEPPTALHNAPLLVERYTPLYVPAYRIAELRGSKTKFWTVVEAGIPELLGAHVKPASIDLKSPPPVVPA